MKWDLQLLNHVFEHSYEAISVKGRLAIANRDVTYWTGEEPYTSSIEDLRPGSIVMLASEVEKSVRMAVELNSFTMKKFFQLPKLVI